LFNDEYDYCFDENDDESTEYNLEEDYEEIDNNEMPITVSPIVDNEIMPLNDNTCYVDIDVQFINRHNFKCACGTGVYSSALNKRKVSYDEMFHYMTTSSYPEHIEKLCDELPPSKIKNKSARNIYLYRWRDSFNKNYFLKQYLICKKNRRL
jgi:hypothetical protein